MTDPIPTWPLTILLIAGVITLVSGIISVLLYRQYRQLQRERDLHAEHMQLIFDHTGEGIALLRHGQIIRINQSGARLLGKDSQTLAGRSLIELLDQVDPEMTDALKSDSSHS
jgi:PAS domain-containing protein